MKRNFRNCVFPSLLLCLSLLAGCGGRGESGTGGGASLPDVTVGGAISDDHTVETVAPDTETHRYVFFSRDGDSYTYFCEDCGNYATVTVSCTEGTADCVKVEGNTITLSGMTERSVYALSGVFYGNVAVEGNENCEIELELCGLTLHSSDECPITVSGADQFTLSAKKGSENYLNDLREEVTDSEGIRAAVWADCDMDLQGKGSLYVTSIANNGVHTKDDLKVKNLYLQVDCKDNAIKGNDSVTVESGTLVLIARAGDGIKTSNNDLSKKGKQRGTVAITGGDILIYAACDGIDAAYDVIVDESSGSAPILTIFTDKYSKYSEEITAKDDNTLYLRTSSGNYTYSLYFYDVDTDGTEHGVWLNSGTAQNKGNYRYYSFERPSEYSKFRVYVYRSGETQGQVETYYVMKDDITVSSAYDTLTLQFRGGSASFGWTNYTTQSSGGMGGFGGMGGMGGMNDGNRDKGDHSTKGLKAANAIAIGAGMITIESYDDCLHANNDSTLESGAAATGTVTITGGTLTLSSCDDAIHADGAVEISDGNLSVLKSYEGIEGTTVTISGGNVSVVSSDDGLNGTATSGTAIAISGGTIYVYANGDGLDSNSRTSYRGIVFSGGRTVVISSGNADSAIDTEAGYAFEGGYVVAVGTSGGMNANESTHCSNFSSVGTKKSLSLTLGGYLTVDGVVTFKMPTSMNAVVVCLGKTNADLSSSSTGTADLAWLVNG